MNAETGSDRPYRVPRGSGSDERGLPGGHVFNRFNLLLAVDSGGVKSPAIEVST